MAIVLDGTANTITAAATSATTATALSTASGSAPSYSARAWVNFNGTGAVAIVGSGNVSSITDNGTGDYTLNFTTAMSDANYAVSSTNATLNANLSYYAVGIRNQNPPDTKSTTALRIQCGNSATGGAADSAQMNVTVFR
jgi:hypothetical protein